MIGYQNPAIQVDLPTQSSKNFVSTQPPKKHLKKLSNIPF